MAAPAGRGSCIKCRRNAAVTLMLPLCRRHSRSRLDRQWQAHWITSEVDLWHRTEAQGDGPAAPNARTERQKLRRRPECFGKFFDHGQRRLTASALPLQNCDSRNTDSLRQNGWMYARSFSDSFQPRGEQLGTNSAAAQGNSHYLRNSNILLFGHSPGTAKDPCGGWMVLRLVTSCFEASSFTLIQTRCSQTLPTEQALQAAHSETPHGTLQISSMGQIHSHQNRSSPCQLLRSSLSPFTPSAKLPKRMPSQSAPSAAGSQQGSSARDALGAQYAFPKATSKRSAHSATQCSAIGQERTANEAKGPKRKFGKTVVVKPVSFQHWSIQTAFSRCSPIANRPMGPCKFHPLPLKCLPETIDPRPSVAEDHTLPAPPVGQFFPAHFSQQT